MGFNHVPFLPDQSDERESLLMLMKLHTFASISKY